MDAELIRWLRALVKERRWGVLTLVVLGVALVWVVTHPSAFFGNQPGSLFRWDPCPPEHSPPLTPRRIALSATVTSMAITLRKFHEQEHLLSLAPLDADKPLTEMPVATYGYVSGLRLDPKVKRLVADDRIQASGAPAGTKFEVLKNLQGQVWLVAFVSAVQSAGVVSPSAGVQDITLFPRPWEGACDLLIIPESSLESAGTRTIHTGRDRTMLVIDARLDAGGE